MKLWILRMETKNNQTRKNMKEEGRKEESQMFNNALVAAKIN